MNINAAYGEALVRNKTPLGRLVDKLSEERPNLVARVVRHEQSDSTAVEFHCKQGCARPITTALEDMHITLAERVLREAIQVIECPHLRMTSDASDEEQTNPRIELDKLTAVDRLEAVEVKAGYPASTAEMAQAVGRGAWTAGYALGKLAPAFGALTAASAPTYSNAAAPKETGVQISDLVRSLHDAIRRMTASIISPVVAVALTFEKGAVYVDGVCPLELLERYITNQRERPPVFGMAGPMRWEFTQAQLLMAKHLWSVQLRERVRKSAEAERHQVVCDVQDID